jgi:HK97 family phage major capsid protein
VSAYIDRLFDQYRSAVDSGRQIMDRAAAETRDLTAEEHETLDRTRAAAGDFLADIQRIKAHDARGAAGDAFFASARGRIERSSRDRGQLSLRDMFLRTLDQGHVGVTMTPTVDDDVYTVRALQSAGGSAVETSFADFVTVYERTMTPLLRPDVVGLQNVPDGSPRVYPRVTADPNHGGTVTAEAAGINELDMTASQVTLNPYKYAVINLYSAELAQDSAIDLEDIIGFTTARELSIDIGTHLTTGDGSGKPAGFLNDAANGGTASGTGATYGTYFGPTDLVNLFYGRAEPYRNTGVWQANGTTLAQIRNARSTTGEHIWQPSLVPGAPETLLGRPIYENPAMANGSAAKAVAFGDFSRFIVSRTPLRVETSIHHKFGTDQISLRVIERVDSELVDAIAVAYLVNAAV